MHPVEQIDSEITISTYDALTLVQERVIEELSSHAVHSSPYELAAVSAKNGLEQPAVSGLYRCYQKYLKRGILTISHVWVVRRYGCPIGVALLLTSKPAFLELYVKPAFRSRGYGRRLTLKAVALGIPFQGYHTNTSAPLYTSLNIAHQATIQY